LEVCWCGVYPVLTPQAELTSQKAAAVLHWLFRSLSVFEEEDGGVQETVLPCDLPAWTGDISVWKLFGCLSVVQATQRHLSLTLG